VGVFLRRDRGADTQGSETLSSVAVLPFLDLSPQKDQEYFSDGLSEEIIDALSRVKNLRVAARTSAFAFKGKTVDIRQIGRELNVSAVLEGSVRKSGEELRITAQLNRVSDGFHLWSRTYERPMRDIFALQRELSQAIAEQLRAGDVPPRQTTSNAEAHRLYQEGHYFFSQHQVPDSYARPSTVPAGDRLDPGTHGVCGPADAHMHRRTICGAHEVMPKARAAAEKAVALDDTSADAHTSLGLKLDYDRTWLARSANFRWRCGSTQLRLHQALVRAFTEAQNRLEDALGMRAARALTRSRSSSVGTLPTILLANQTTRRCAIWQRPASSFPTCPCCVLTAQVFTTKRISNRLTVWWRR
jgi:TolB-like protein